MHDDEGKCFSAVLAGPRLHRRADCGGDVGRLRPGIDEQGSVRPEEKVEKRLLEIRARRLTQDDEVVVVSVLAKDRRLRTRRACRP